MSDENGSINGAPSAKGTEPIVSEVAPAIVPTQYVVDQVSLSNGMLVTMLRLFTPTGVHVTFWPEDSAEELGKELINSGRATKSGLIIPGKKIQ